MSDIEIAKSNLVGDKTCVLVRGKSVLSSTHRGIAPIMEWIEAGVDLAGYSLADRMVGKAIAMLVVYTGIREVYTHCMSESAIEYLSSHGVKFQYATKTKRVLNRARDGLCPMESTVQELDDPKSAYIALRAKLNEMKGK